jgi:RNA-binding protein YlmH
LIREVSDAKTQATVLETALKEKAMAMEHLKTDKDREVSHIYIDLIQISVTQATCRELESQISNLHAQISSIKNSSRKALEQAIEDTEFKVYFLKTVLMKGPEIA